MAAFELRERAGPELDALELPVGPWRRAPGMAAYGADADAGPREPVWRVELAHADAAGRAVLAAGARSVAEAHAGLDELPRRLEAALAEAALADVIAGDLPDAAEMPAWSADAGALRRMALARPRAPMRPPEAALIAALIGAAELPGASERMAWSPGASELAGEHAPEPGWLALSLDRIADLARGRTRIETHLEGALVAHSRMALDGDTELWIGPRLSPAGAALHARSVAVAMRTRHAWARILTLIMTSHSRLLVLGLPAGVAALPMIWRFVRDVLREARRHAAAAPA